MTGTPRKSLYDDFVPEYGAYTEWREQDGPEHDPFGILPHLLAVLGDVRGRAVLDAGCGEGYLSRILAARGARVTGADLGPRLVERARQRDPGGPTEYLVADLSEPQPATRRSRASWCWRSASRSGRRPHPRPPLPVRGSGGAGCIGDVTPAS